MDCHGKLWDVDDIDDDEYDDDEYDDDDDDDDPDNEDGYDDISLFLYYSL
jgi:hypothetical protein